MNAIRHKMFQSTFILMKFYKEYYWPSISFSGKTIRECVERTEGGSNLLLHPFHPQNIPDDDILTANCLSINLEQGFVL
jgi:hypothetical protein